MVYITSSQNKFVSSNSPITVNLSKYKKAPCFLYKGKKVLYGSFYENEQFLDSSASTHFTLFKSKFVDMTPDNYGRLGTANSKVLLFIVASNIILIEYKIFNPEKETTKVAVLLATSNL